ncbi:hypothetical protein O3G_MSEX000351 [Manduca sexta]|nr:hypothetical protein O3G_MSEX000351 [Manduca sexta]
MSRYNIVFKMPHIILNMALETLNCEKMSYHFGLKNGAIFFAIFGILCWSTEMLYERNNTLIFFLDKHHYKLFYIAIFTLYVLCSICFVLHTKK